MKGNILLVDDDQGMCEMIKDDLQLRGYDVTWDTSGLNALKLLKKGQFDVVLTDLRMTEIDGISLCQKIVSSQPDLPVVVMTAFGSMETAVDAIRAGAFDFIVKPMELDMLNITLKRAIGHHILKEKVRALNKVVERVQEFDTIIGASPQMQQLYEHMERIISSDISVLITGESGTGKELIAKALHDQSPRSNKPYIAINCAAIPETLFESEIFGHEKGSYTDAKTSRKGLFSQANGGTLFLDEIGDFPLHLQPKLLRALEEKKVRPIGSDKELTADVRILTATNKDLEEQVKAGVFREDLLFRINVIQLQAPPLRSRGTDILILARYFTDFFASKYDKQVDGISHAANEKLLTYQWPGNVRELKNIIERAIALTNHNKLIIDDFPEKIKKEHKQTAFWAPKGAEDMSTLADIEKSYILHVVDKMNQNQTLAAQILGIDRKTLYRKLQQYEKSRTEITS